MQEDRPSYDEKFDFKSKKYYIHKRRKIMNNYKPNWNKRNGQRATVKRPGTKEYRADYNNRNNQFFEKQTKPGCLSCGSTNVVARGGNGRLFIFCARCGKQLKVINTKPTKVGNWSSTTIYRVRAGLCTECGGDSFVGKMHLDQSHKGYVLTTHCTRCGALKGRHRL